MTAHSPSQKTEIALFGVGCFWCTEAVYKMLRGVISIMPGYCGGTMPNPTYEQVSSGTTGYVECVKIEFDPSVISYANLLDVFFATHDPTSLDRQGNDVGPQYRSTIFSYHDEQKTEAERYIATLNGSDEGKPIVTEVKPASTFYPAEDYHRDYYAHYRNAPYCRLVIDPKLKKIHKHFSSLLAEAS